MNYMAKTICLIGVDGSGKSTIVQKLCDEFRSKNINAQTYYFGWQPFLPTTRLLSRIFRKNNYRITEDFNKKNKKFSFLQEITLCYFFLEYFMRYVSIKSSPVLIFDRYFYDIYAHYSYAERSLLFPLLLRLFPRPHNLFVFDVPTQIAHQRKPEMEYSLVEAHRNRYLALAKKLKARVLSTNEPIQVTISTIMEAIK